MNLFRHMNNLLAGIGSAVQKDIEEFEREALKDLPEGYTETTEVTTESHNGVLVKVTKVIRKTKRL